MRKPMFTSHEDGGITVDDWCREVTFSQNYLNYGITNRLTGVVWKPVENTVTITVSNGRAVYQLSGPDADGHWPGLLIEAELDLPEAEPQPAKEVRE